MADSTADPPLPSPPLSDDDTEIPLTTLFEPNGECICDFGDIMLNADDGFHPPQKLRVSSCILAMSSKVFKALFSKKFAEGQAGVGRSLERRHEILVKDRSTPLKHLCMLLHHQKPYQSPSQTLSADALLELALVADKYDAVEAISLQAEALLSVQKDRADEHGDIFLYEFIAAATLLEQLEAFRFFTAQLISTHLKIPASYMPSKVVNLIPPNLLSAMRIQQSEARQEFTTEVMSLVQQFSKSCTMADKKMLCNDFIEELTGASLMPLNFKYRSLETSLLLLKGVDIPVIAQKVVSKKEKKRNAGVEIYDTDNGWGSPRLRRRESDDFLVVYTVDSEEEIIQDAPTHRSIARAIEKVEGMCDGICLDCIRDKECRSCSSKDDGELSDIGQEGGLGWGGFGWDGLG